MIIDQLFEDDKKKKLNEIDPRNYDSDEDYYAAVRGNKRSSSDDDYDYEPEDDINDMDDDESYYEKYVRTKNLEGYETTPFGGVINSTPNYSQAWKVTDEGEEFLRKAYQRLKRAYNEGGQVEMINIGPALSELQQQKFGPAYVQQSGPYQMMTTDISRLIEKIEPWQKQYNQQHIATDFDPEDFSNWNKQQGMSENTSRKVDAKGRTQSEWMQAVKQKFPNARIVQAKMIDGPAHAMLPDGRKLSWTPVQGMAESYDTAEDYRAKAQWLMRTHHLRPDEAMEYAYYDTDPDTWVGSPWEDDYKQGMAEAKASTAAFRASNAKRAKLNAMSPEERKEYDKEQAEKQRKRDDARLERERQKNAAKKGLSEMDKSQKGAPGWNISDDEPGGKESYGKAVKAKDVAKKAGKALDKAFDKAHSKKKIKESRQRQLYESMLMEDPVYRKFKRVGRYIAERKMSEKEILQVFADAEAGMTDKATGANRTFLGRGKDTAMDFAGGVADAVKSVLNSIQNSVPVSAVDVAYDQATDALANVAGGQKGAVMQAIKKYRNLVKQYPKTAGFAKAALVAIAGLATGGAGLPVIAGLTYALDSAIKGDKLSSVIGKGAGAAALSAAGQAIHGATATPTGAEGLDPSQFPAFDDDGNLMPGFHINPEDGSAYYNPDIPNEVGGLTDTTGTTGDGGGLPGQFDGGQYTVQKGDQIGYIAQANGVKTMDIEGLNPQIDFSKPLQPGTTLNLPPQGDGAGSVWDGYTGGNYGDKVAGAAGDTAQSVGGSAPIDYTQAGPVSTDSLGQKLEYGIPVNDKGSFIPPNPDLPAGELAKQQAAYDAWKSDFMKRFPNATQMPDGSMQGIKPGLAPMGPTNYTPGMNTNGLTPKMSVSGGGGEGVISSGGTDQLMQTPAYKQAFADNMKRFGGGAWAQQDAHRAALAAAKAAMVKESTEWLNSIKIRKLPVDKLIDQKTTVLSWALNESIGRKSKSVNLTTGGTYVVFENVDRYRKAVISELKGVPGSTRPALYRPDMPGAPVTPDKKPGLIGRGLNWLDKAAGKVGGALSNFGHQFTTNVTKEKLKMNWHQAGKPSDSDALAAWLVKQGVPQEVVTSVYGKMGIPYTAPATPAAAEPAQQAPADATAQKELPWLGKDLKTKQNRTVDQMVAEPGDPAAATTTATAPATTTATANPAGFDAGNIFKQPGMEKYAKKPAAPAKTPNFAGPGGYAKVNQPTTVSYSGMPGMKPTVAPVTAKLPAGGGAGVKAAAPAGQPAQLSKDEYIKRIGAPALPESRIVSALKKPVAEMLQMVETKEDVVKIKQFIDQTFVKYGAVSESAFVVRNRLIEHVTQVGAQRRREFARKS